MKYLLAGAIGGAVTLAGCIAAFAIALDRIGPHYTKTDRVVANRPKPDPRLLDWVGKGS